MIYVRVSRESIEHDLKRWKWHLDVPSDDKAVNFVSDDGIVIQLREFEKEGKETVRVWEVKLLGDKEKEIYRREVSYDKENPDNLITHQKMVAKFLENLLGGIPVVFRDSE